MIRPNARARVAAQAAGHPTYQHEVIDYWPACTACATPIRHDVDTGRPGLWRKCGCPGVLWRCLTNGWERVPEEGADPGPLHPQGTPGAHFQTSPRSAGNGQDATSPDPLGQP